MTREVARYWSHSALPGVDLLQARYVTHRYNRHTHEGYVIALIEDGAEEFEYGGSLERAGTGSLVLVNPDTVHTGQAAVPEGWAYRCLYPSIEVVSGIADDLGAPRGTPFFPDPIVADPDAARLVRAVHRSGEHGDALATSSLFRTMVEAVLRHARPGAHLDEPDGTAARMSRAVEEAREILHESLLDPPSLEELAAAVGVGAFPLLRAFRAATGLPPHAYLNQQRVRRARRLLDAGLRPAEVAARTGFADQAHLTRHFKRTVGVPPGAYRQGRAVLIGGTLGVGR